MTLPELLKVSCAKFAQRLSLNFVANGKRTYQDLYNEVMAVARHLLRIGVRKGDKVAILSANMPNWGIAQFAIAQTGAVTVPILPGFSATELKKQLSGKTAGVQPSVEHFASSMNGSASPKDLETMLQLLYLNFTQPRFDRNDYDNLMKMLRAQLANVQSNPDYRMQEKTMEVVYGNNPRRRMVSDEIIGIGV